MPPPDTISNDLPCHQCGYNLRGLTFEGRCPECGASNRTSFEVAASLVAELLHEHPDTMERRLRYQAIADEIDGAIDALLFVIDAVTESSGFPPNAALNPRAICEAVESRARRYFNDAREARELLEEWGIRTGADIARIALVLTRHKLLTIEGEPTEAAFERLFSIQSITNMK